MEADTMCSIFQDNLVLCSEVKDTVVQHFINCIATHGRHEQYIRFLQTLVKADNQFVRRCQDMVMQEVNQSLNIEFSDPDFEPSKSLVFPFKNLVIFCPKYSLE